jgi:methionyl-tRNA synthetase
MNAARLYVSTTIPYVNARPHLGFALELVQADVLARQYRLAGDQVRFQTGTDDNSLKNVLAAEAEGVAIRDLVDRNTRAFAGLRGPLGLSFDDFLATSSDPRHLPGVERLWRACAASGDLYTRDYEGLYCVGCERFVKPSELRDGRCPEHDTPPQHVAEKNWFFRLSRYAGQLRDLITSGRLRIEPAARRNEVLAFIVAGLDDFSASRSADRARGWGIRVPGDPSQVIYVWWDALGNYITALGYGTGSPDYQHWWTAADRRIHLAGKGVLRFHAVYWPAILLSAGEPLPTDILVHDYLTIDGHKISKSKPPVAGGAGPGSGGGPASAGGGALAVVGAAAAPGSGGGSASAGGGALAVVGAAAAPGSGAGLLTATGDYAGDGDAEDPIVDPVTLSAALGTDAVRWWLLRDVPRVGDADFTIAKLVSRANDDLANELGNLVSRVVSLVHRYREGKVPVGQLTGAHEGCALLAACEQAAQRKAEAVDAFDFRAATAAVWDIVTEANRYVELVRPWELAKAECAGDADAGQRLDAALGLLVRACRTLGRELGPFIPDLAAKITKACDDTSGQLAPARPLFPRITGRSSPG